MASRLFWRFDMVAIGRRELLLGASALVLAGCGGAGGGANVSADDMVLGSADAPVTLIEYASVTCPHCAAFHEESFEQLKTNYIDTGKVRFVFREYPTQPAPVAVAGFQVARCGGASSEQYFARVGAIFRTQQALFQSLQADGGRQYFINLGSDAGLTPEQTMACVSDEAGAERIRATVDASREFNITGTPAFIINGQKFDQPPTYENLSRALDAAAS
jgi:protein-disulfide isomerase